jgi:hypothetical protein
MDVKGKLDDSIEKLNDPEIRQKEKEIQDEDSKEYVGQIEEEH